MREQINAVKSEIKYSFTLEHIIDLTDLHNEVLWYMMGFNFRIPDIQH